MPAGDPAGYLPRVKRYRARKQRALGSPIKTSMGKSRIKSIQALPKKGVARMRPSGTRKIGPYTGQINPSGKRNYKSRSRRSII